MSSQHTGSISCSSPVKHGVRVPTGPALLSRPMSVVGDCSLVREAA